MQSTDISIPARDGYALGATCFDPGSNPTNTVIVINSATAVPRRFYKFFAEYLAEQGYTALTYDYRGIGDSKPESLKGFPAMARDWALQDMAGIVDWVASELKPDRLFFIGHSYGGQTAGILPNHEHIDAIVTLSAQSGHWKYQGGNQKLPVLLHTHVSLPLLSLFFGYMPWSKISSAEDLPKGVATEWARWCRHPRYILGDKTLPLERYADFKAPVLAYSFEDDDWGTARSVDAMMTAYPNLTRRHVTPAEAGLEKLGHFGFFRPKTKGLWGDVVRWLEESVPA